MYERQSSFELEAIIPKEFRPLDGHYNFVEVPSVALGFQHVRMVTPCTEAVKFMLDHASQHLKQLAVAEFASWHQRIESKDMPKVRSYVDETTVCMRAGFCLHSPKGALIADLEAAVSRQLQVWSPPKSAMRKALVQSWIVLCLEKRGGNKQAYYWHIAFPHLSHPWRFQLLPMKRIRGYQAALVAPNIPLEVERGADWENSWKSFLQLRDFKHGYLCSAYVLKTPRRLLPEICPSKHHEIARVRGPAVVSGANDDPGSTCPSEEVVPSDSAKFEAALRGAAAARAVSAAGEDHDAGAGDPGGGIMGAGELVDVADGADVDLAAASASGIWEPVLAKLKGRILLAPPRPRTG